MKIIIELKPVDAGGLGGELLLAQGFRVSEETPSSFEKQIVADVGHETTDTRQYARPFIEMLMDDGIMPRRVRTQIRDIGGPSSASAISAAMDAIADAHAVLSVAHELDAEGSDE